MKPTITLFLILSCLQLPAQSHSWVRTNPGGGGAFSTIGAGPTGIVVAGSDLSGAYLSKDHGSTWSVIGSTAGLLTTHVSGVGFDPQDAKILYLGTDDGIYRSGDGGSHFSQVWQGGYVTDIQTAISNPQLVFATYHPQWDALSGALLTSTDRGLHWKLSSNDLPQDVRLLKVRIQPDNPDIVYCLSGKGRFACGPAQLYRSINGGKNWVQLAASLGEILDFAIHPSEPGRLYLTTMHASCDAQYYWTDVQGQIFTTTNGNNWTKLADRSGVIWLDPDRPNQIRLVDPREPFPWNDLAGTWTSSDAGATWKQTGTVEHWQYGYQGNALWSYGTSYNGICKTLGSDLSNPDAMYWVNPQWCFGTQDGGTTFRHLHTREISSDHWLSTGFDNVVAQVVTTHPLNSDLVFVGFWDLGLWRSTDRGKSWQSCNTPAFSGGWQGYGGNTLSLALDPGSEDRLWAVMQESVDANAFLVVNTNQGDGDSWSLSMAGLPATPEMTGLTVDIHSSNENRHLFVTADGDVYRSTNSGINWNKVLDCNGCRYTSIDPLQIGVVYAGGEAGLFRSDESGNSGSWKKIGNAAMQGSIHGPITSWGWEGVSDIVPSEQHPDWVYVAVRGKGKGLFRTQNAGKDWEKMLADDYLYCLAIDPNNDQIMYTGSSSAHFAGGFDGASAGIRFSDNGGKSWTPINDGMAWPFAIDLHIDNDREQRVWVSSPGTGIQYSNVPKQTSSRRPDGDGWNSISVHPNPAHHQMWIEGLPSHVHQIDLCSPLGIRIRKSIQENGSIDLRGIQPGLYFLYVSEGFNEWSTKIIVQ